MKKLMLLVMIFVVALSLVSCGKGQEHSTEVDDVAITNAEPVQDETDYSERPGATRFIIGIWDKTEQEQIACVEIEEKFYEDETTEYYFNVVKSQHIFVSYNNANSEDIVTALKSGRATIADLDFYGIEYHTKPKK